MMTIRAPLDGIITTWEVKKNLLGRPVEIGHELLEYRGHQPRCRLGARGRRPRRRHGTGTGGHGASCRRRSPPARSSPGEALKAYFVTATDPDHKYEGYVRRIASKAEMVEQKHVDKVTVGFDEAVRQDFLSRNQELRPGSEVRARVDCGKTRLSYVPAPQGRSGLVRVGDVPLAVPSLRPRAAVFVGQDSNLVS